MIIIQTTLQTKEKAAEIGKALLHNRLIACYNLLPIESGYWWQGNIQEEHEVLLIIKTRDEHFDAITIYLTEHSGYKVPEVLAFKPEKVNLPYLNWINEETESVS